MTNHSLIGRQGIGEGQAAPVWVGNTSQARHWSWGHLGGCSGVLAATGPPPSAWGGGSIDAPALQGWAQTSPLSGSPLHAPDPSSSLVSKPLSWPSLAVEPVGGHPARSGPGWRSRTSRRHTERASATGLGLSQLRE